MIDAVVAGGSHQNDAGGGRVIDGRLEKGAVCVGAERHGDDVRSCFDGGDDAFGQIEGGAFAVGVEHGDGKQFNGRRESGEFAVVCDEQGGHGVAVAGFRGVLRIVEKIDLLDVGVLIDDGFGDGGVEYGDGDAVAAFFLCGVYAEPVQQTGAEAWSEPAGPWFDGVFRNPDDVVLRGGNVVEFVFQSGEGVVVENDIDGTQRLERTARTDAQFRKPFQNGEILLVILGDERRLARSDFRGVEMFLL